MNKYLTKVNFLLIMIIFIGLRFTDFNQTMTSFWVGPVLSAAVNFDWSNLNMYVNWDEIEIFAKLSKDEFWEYNFINTNDLMKYDYLAKGLVLLIILSKKIFFFAGDMEALQYLQYLVHIVISIFTLSLFEKKYQKILFFILYAINPLVLWVVNYPFYYFWSVIPSFIFVYWYFKKDISFGLLSAFSVILAYIYITRPTVLLLIILFYILFSFKNGFKKAFFGFIIFFGLISIAPNLSIGPWHTMYIGIGAYSNPYNVKLDDEDGYSYYKKQTGKVVSSGNIMVTKVKNDYYNILKERYMQIIQERPLMLLKHCVLNTIQAYSFGYSNSLNQKFGNKIIYFSLLIGTIIILLLLYTKQYILFLAIGFASGSFTLYYPPILTYMFGNFILLVIGFIGIIDYFIKQRELKNEK
jgi:hypothetical protein